MSDVEIALPDGTTTTLSVAQARTLALLCRENPGSIWHHNDCGCCVCLHPGGDTEQGYVIGPDGIAEYHEVSHG